MEINQDLEVDIPQWISSWATFLLKQHSNPIEVNESSLNSITEILMATTRGDSCVARSDIDISNWSNLIVETTQAEQHPAPFVVDQQAVYLYRYWKLEQRLATEVARLYRQQVSAVDVSPFAHLLTDEHQQRALQMVATHALNIITGGPGTGKTYTLARIVAVLNHLIPNLRVAMAAPTGKAAQRMKEALQNALNNQEMMDQGFDLAQLKQQETFTIHRLLGLGNQAKPKYHAQKPLPYDVIVIDEASMLDLQLATMLFEAIPNNCRLILLGDANQLASVDVGSVLAELQQVIALNDHRVNLLTSRRFKSGARIGEMAQFIHSLNIENLKTANNVLAQFEAQICSSGEIMRVELSEGMQDIVQLEYLPDHISDEQFRNYYQKLSIGFETYFTALMQYIQNGYAERDIEAVVQKFDDYRILAAIQHGHLGLQRLNQEIESIWLKKMKIMGQGLWYVGRPVMMTYNDYQLGISNGDIGICFQHRQFNDQFEVYFPSLDLWLPASRLPKSMQTCFALSIHKSQGSEFKHTAVVLDQFATRLLSQELIYTAITRAKSVVTLLVHPQALAQSLLEKTSRKSGLLNKLNDLVIPKGH